jgi:hypothetical protein
MLVFFRLCGGRLSRKRRITNYSYVPILFHRYNDDVPITDMTESVIHSNVGKQKSGYIVHIQLIHGTDVCYSMMMNLLLSFSALFLISISLHFIHLASDTNCGATGAVSNFKIKINNNFKNVLLAGIYKISLFYL